MGVGGIGTMQLLIILAIVILIFGTKKIAGLGWDLGSAVKGMRAGFKEAKEGADELAPEIEELRKDYEHTSDRIRSLKS